MSGKNAVPVQSIEGGPMMPPEFWQHVQKMTREEMARPLDFPRAPEDDTGTSAS